MATAAAVAALAVLLNELQTARLCLLNVRLFIIKTKYFSLQQILQKFNCNCKQKPESAQRPKIANYTHTHIHSTYFHMHTHSCIVGWMLAGQPQTSLNVLFFFCVSWAGGWVPIPRWHPASGCPSSTLLWLCRWCNFAFKFITWHTRTQPAIA